MFGSIGDIMRISKTKTPGVSIGKVSGQDLPTDPEKNVASVAAMALLKETPTEFGFQIDIEKK